MDEHENPLEGGVTSNVAEKWKYKELLFDLIMLTNRSHDLSEFKKNLDLIECMMSPYAYERDRKGKIVYVEREVDGKKMSVPKLNETYSSLIDNARQNFIKELDKAGGNPISESTYFGYEWMYQKAKYSALIDLAFMRGMLPQYELGLKVV